MTAGIHDFSGQHPEPSHLFTVSLRPPSWETVTPARASSGKGTGWVGGGRKTAASFAARSGDACRTTEARNVARRDGVTRSRSGAPTGCHLVPGRSAVADLSARQGGVTCVRPALGTRPSLPSRCIPRGCGRRVRRQEGLPPIAQCRVRELKTCARSRVPDQRGCRPTARGTA